MSIAATTTISSACPRCGTIKKSGKSSCCGRGGFWFEKCGSAGNVKVDHTWYEGIQACNARAQFKTVIDQKSNAAQHHNSPGNANWKVDITSAKIFISTNTNASTPMPVKTPVLTPAHKPTDTPTTTTYAASTSTAYRYAAEISNASVAAATTMNSTSVKTSGTTPSNTPTDTSLTTSGHTLMADTSTRMLMIDHTSASMSIAAHGYDKLLNIVFYTILVLNVVI